MTERTPLSRDEEWRYAEPAMRWYGFGSPVGLGIGVLCLAVSALLVRFAIVGF